MSKLNNFGNKDKAQTTLQLICDRKPGTLLRTISSLRNENVKVVSQQSSQLVSYDLVLEGCKQDFEAALESTQHVDGIIDVIVLDEEVNLPSTVGPKPSPKKNQAKASQKPDTKLEQIKNKEDDDLFLSYELAAAFPRVEPLLVKHLGSASKQEIRDVGWHLAALRCVQLAPIKRGTVYIELLEEWLLPELNLIADAQLDIDGIKVTKFKFNGGAEPDKGKRKESPLSEKFKCSFIAGYIEGLMSQSRFFTNLKVEEIFSTYMGYPYCLFGLIDQDI